MLWIWAYRGDLLKGWSCKFVIYIWCPFGVNITKVKWLCCCYTWEAFFLLYVCNHRFLVVSLVVRELNCHNDTTKFDFCFVYITKQFGWQISVGYVTMTNATIWQNTWPFLCHILAMWVIWQTTWPRSWLQCYILCYTVS